MLGLFSLELELRKHLTPHGFKFTSSFRKYFLARIQNFPTWRRSPSLFLIWKTVGKSWKIRAENNQWKLKVNHYVVRKKFWLRRWDDEFLLSSSELDKRTETFNYSWYFHVRFSLPHTQPTQRKPICRFSRECREKTFSGGIFTSQYLFHSLGTFNVIPIFIFLKRHERSSNLPYRRISIALWCH